MRNDLVIEKMIQSIEKIQSYCTGLDYEAFTDNSMVVEACVFNLSQLGEMVNKIDSEYQAPVYNFLEFQRNKKYKQHLFVV